MLNPYKYIIAVVSVILLFIGTKYYFLMKDYKELTLKHTSLQAKYVVERANVETLKNAIQSQNMLIHSYKKSSDDYRRKIDNLNEELRTVGKKEVVYETTNNKEATSEEALRWLRERAPSLVR